MNYPAQAQLPINNLGRLPIESLSSPFGPSFSHHTPYNYHNNYVDSPKPSKSPKGPVDYSILNDSISHARNYKGRLFNADPKEELDKQKAQQHYRQQLRIQMQDDKKRKAAQKVKEEEEDARIQRKFYDNINIEAQQKALKNQGPNYFVMRTAKGTRKNQKDRQENKLSSSAVQDSRVSGENLGNVRNTLYAPPKIVKRGGYHNQSSLDQTKNYPIMPNPQDKSSAIVEISSNRIPSRSGHSANHQKTYELLKIDLVEQQDRISNLQMFQQSMMKKLDNFKKQIYQTNRSLRLEEEFQQIKLKLRAKTINMQKVYSLAPSEGVQDMLQHSDLYQLPIISNNRKIYEGKREGRNKKLTPLNSPTRNLQEIPRKQMIQLQDRRSQFDDKNFPPEVEEPQQIKIDNDNYEEDILVGN